MQPTPTPLEIFFLFAPVSLIVTLVSVQSLNHATRNKCIATSNKGITSSNKKHITAPSLWVDVLCFVSLSCKERTQVTKGGPKAPLGRPEAPLVMSKCFRTSEDSITHVVKF